jgi:hypothetical protein
MNDPAPERFTVSYSLTADEYAHYAAAVDRRSRSWTSFYIFVAMGFGAIPVALLFRALAAQRLNHPDVIEMVGEYSLYAYGIAIIVTWVGTSLLTWIMRRRYFRTNVHMPGPMTAEFDHTGLTVTSRGVRGSYEWAEVSHCALKQGLLLIWIAPSTAAVIPTRSFANEAAAAAAHAFVRARIAEAKAKLAQAASDAQKSDPNPA